MTQPEREKRDNASATATASATAGDDVVEVLRAARALIEDPEHWTRGWFARDSDGQGVDPPSTSAVCWCAHGAIKQVAPNARTDHRAFRALERAIRPVFSGVNLHEFNDGPKIKSDPNSPPPRSAPSRHRRVLWAFDHAIIEAEAKASAVDEAAPPNTSEVQDG